MGKPRVYHLEHRPKMMRFPYRPESVLVGLRLPRQWNEATKVEILNAAGIVFWTILIPQLKGHGKKIVLYPGTVIPESWYPLRGRSLDYPLRVQLLIWEPRR